MEATILVKIDKFNLPDELYYTDDHVWARIEDGKVKVGLNDFGQHIAGKILFIRIRPQGRPVVQGKAFSSIETGKWVGSLTSPVNGKILEINAKLKSQPTLINDDPYGEGWIALLEPSNLEDDLKKLVHGPEVVSKWMEKEMEEKLKEQ
ncbi:MAG: glycine cleavage system protein H [Promethearchaeota archaeon]